MDAPRSLDLANRPKPAARARAGRVPNLGLIAGAKRRERATSLSIVLAGDEPPNEFRIFTAGTVETSKGTFTFDEAAASAVMADYAKQGNELMVDYDHASLAGISLDPAQSGKAAGWFNIELRSGELWATNVRWTQPAADALRRKEWRYMSPAFSTGEGGQILGLLNVALTNIPATRKLEPLMAASVTALGENGMTVEEFLKVLKALGVDPSTPLDEAIAKIKGEKPDNAAEDAADGGADDAVETPMAPVAAADGAAPPAKEDQPAAVAASISKLMRLSGKTSFVDAIASVETWRESHLELETERQKLAKERETLESAERRKLCVELVTLGGRAPATVWADDKATAPKAYLAAMPMPDLRAMHADTVKANAGKVPPKPPGGKVVKATADTDPVDALGLTAKEHEYCKAAGCEPAAYASIKSRTT